MSRALSSSTPPRNLMPADTRTDMLVRRFSNHLEETADFRRRAIPDRLAPTDEERHALKVRVAEIDDGLTRASAASIRRAVGLVKGLMASPSVTSAAADEVLSGYALVLAPFPQSVVEDVCARFLDGRLGNRVYAPTPAEIAHECREALAPVYAERAQIARILDAEVYATPSEAERARVEQMHAAFVEELTQRAAKTHAENKRDGAPITGTGSASAERQQALADLAARKAKREADEQSSLSEQLKAGREPFVASERKGEAA